MRIPSISTTRHIQQTPARVYAYLVHLENHWRLGGRALSVERLDENGRGGRVVISAPLGIRRTARTAVTILRRPHRLGGVARVGRRTRARVTWIIEPAGRGARVCLESTIASASIIDRVLLALGGRWWLRQAFGRTLEALARELYRDDRGAAPDPTDGDPSPAPVLVTP